MCSTEILRKYLSINSEQLSEAHDDEVVWPEYQIDNQFDEQQFETNGMINLSIY